MAADTCREVKHAVGSSTILADRTEVPACMQCARGTRVTGPCLKGAAVPFHQPPVVGVLMRPMLVHPLQQAVTKVVQGPWALLATQVTHDVPVHVAVQLCQQRCTQFCTMACCTDVHLHKTEDLLVRAARCLQQTSGT